MCKKRYCTEKNSLSTAGLHSAPQCTQINLILDYSLASTNNTFAYNIVSPSRRAPYATSTAAINLTTYLFHRLLFYSKCNQTRHLTLHIIYAIWIVSFSV